MVLLWQFFFLGQHKGFANLVLRVLELHVKAFTRLDEVADTCCKVTEVGPD